MNSFISEMPGPDGGRERARAGPAGADHHADRGQFVLGLQDREAVLLGLGITRYFWQKPRNASISDVAGVIGYQAPTVAPA